MVAKYRLHRDTYGFIESAKQVVTIPTGAVVTLIVREATPFGLCTVAWEGKLIEAFREDLQRNGTMISENGIVGGCPVRGMAVFARLAVLSYTIGKPECRLWTNGYQPRSVYIGPTASVMARRSDALLRNRFPKACGFVLRCSCCVSLGSRLGQLPWLGN